MKRCLNFKFFSFKKDSHIAELSSLSSTCLALFINIRRGCMIGNATANNQSPNDVDVCDYNQ